MEKRKYIIGAFSIELFSFYGINGQEDQVNRFLRKVIKRSAGFNDVSEKGMMNRCSRTSIITHILNSVESLLFSRPVFAH